MSEKKMKVMVDALGNAVPVKYVSKYDRDNDRIVNRIFERYVKTRKMLEDVMIETIRDLESIRALRESHGLRAEGSKGNVGTSSFDGNTRVEYRVRYEIALDDRVTQARELMLAYIKDALDKVGNAEAQQALMALVEGAFKATSSGGLSIARVMALLRVNINAKKWLEARTLLVESMKGQRGKSYIVVSQRRDRNHQMKQIRLDIADCWPALDD